MTSHLYSAAAHTVRWLASTEDDEHGEGEHFGVHIEYEDLYDSIIFLCCIYVGGQIANFCRMPSLVGEIIVGILLGPPLADYVPNPEAFVMLGEIGLVLLVVEAGIDVDVSTLKLIGTRGLMIALIGSVLPIGLGIVIAIMINGTENIKESIAAGATFGPTSVGVALSILRSGGVLNTPVGQLIISAAVIDDMIALIVLSQLESLTGTIDAASVLIPVVSAVGFLVLGGYVALFIFPPLVHKYLHPKIPEENLGKAELAIMFGILLFMMPATYYAKASYLMGGFIAGLAFCTSHDLHVEFVRQLKRVMQWLLRIFFAASIGFQVPIKDLFKGSVIWKGLVFCIALLGKLAVGFMVPNFTQSASFTGYHLRDCLITGFSMAAEGEFAFVIAVFSVSEGLISEDLYAAVVLAVLISTIIPPFLLRFTIGYYNKKSADELEALAQEEMERNHNLDSERPSEQSPVEREDALVAEIRNQTAVFLCIQTQSEAKWGLMHNLMAQLAKSGLEVIDHRAWHPRGIDSTLVNEIYAKDILKRTEDKATNELLDVRMEEIRVALEGVINQEEARVKVQRWFPGVVEEITESVHEKHGNKKKSKLSLEASLLKEATANLRRSQTIQTHATKEKSVKEILEGMQEEILVPDEALTAAAAAPTTAPRPRRRRQKMRSTPVVGGGLFGETTAEEKQDDFQPKKSGDQAPPKFTMSALGMKPRGHRAEISVGGETYDVRLSEATLKNLRSAFSGDMIGLGEGEGLSIQADTNDVTTMLKGFVRQGAPLTRITEDDESDTSSAHGGKKQHTHSTIQEDARSGNEDNDNDVLPV
mmetsp:Transcript_9262/g.20862  ORF Transcript_9262/g.20862 Transcript_9262/m.20862 type:complete len:818 (-) Transcript_9262:112-2565(-)|eukprot:CAMPEP_0168730042 /NCGR_PEP_ID=MMETSP0724-20121128/6531_1 /TAXON_ID=265536 /ORGANISM="Amphiprora sp., Strain CCMP467" /LENGTH=817 /DNA_ID=CAMNT_0008776977 /DNA_START=204 /DNA_END=2657 /DNA_ORIENTATION=+